MKQKIKFHVTGQDSDGQILAQAEVSLLFSTATWGAVIGYERNNRLYGEEAENVLRGEY